MRSVHWLHRVTLITALAIIAHVFQPASAKPSDDCLEDSDTVEIIGGFAGGVAGVGAAVAAGAATVTAVTVSPGIIVGVVGDCALTGCLITLGTVVTGLVAGIFAGRKLDEWMFGNCAGSIARNQETARFFWSSDHESTYEGMVAALHKCQKGSSNQAEACQVVLPFRYCVAVAKDVKSRAWRTGRGRTASEANHTALKECEAAADRECRLIVNSLCNSG